MKIHYRSSLSSDSVFGDDYPYQGGLLPPPPRQYRPFSVHSISNIHSPMKEDDTMISVHGISHFFGRLYKFTSDIIFLLQMLGGGHVRRRSDLDPFGLLLEHRLVSVLRNGNILRTKAIQIYNGHEDDHLYDSPNKARIVEKPSITSTSSYQFGGERMINAQRGVSER
jgi:serine/arginine repetitive matrix protein 2